MKKSKKKKILHLSKQTLERKSETGNASVEGGVRNELDTLFTLPLIFLNPYSKIPQLFQFVYVKIQNNLTSM